MTNISLKEVCSGLCINASCGGVHDVTLINFTNAVNNIRLVDYNTSNIILDNPAVLNCNQKYKVYIDAKNKTKIVLLSLPVV